MHSNWDFQSRGGASSSPHSWHMQPLGATRRLPGGRFHSAPHGPLSPGSGRRADPGPLSPLAHMASLCPLPSCSGVGLFLMVVVIVPKVAQSLPVSPLALASQPGVSVLFSDKSRPRSGLPGEGGGWVWRLQPLSLLGAAAAPPPLGTQMGFIQQTKPPPHPGHTGTWTQASPWEGGGDRRSRQVLFASLLFFIPQNPGFNPQPPPLPFAP